MNYYDLLKKILEIEPTLEEACGLKLEFDQFYEENNYASTKNELEKLIQKFLLSSITDMNAFGRTLVEWKEDIINSFITVKNNYQVDKDTGKVTVQQTHISNAIE